MKTVLYYLLFFFISLTSNGQLMLKAGPVYNIKDKFWEPGGHLASIDYSLSIGYKFNRFYTGFEFMDNNYISSGYEPYSFKQFQFSANFNPLKKTGLFLSGSVGMGYEKRSYTQTEIKYENGLSVATKNIIDEFGNYLVFTPGFGYEDRLIKDFNLFLGATLSYSYLHEIKSFYTPVGYKGGSFFSFKLNLCYLIKLKRK
jgi:hypothetical protein